MRSPADRSCSDKDDDFAHGEIGAGCRGAPRRRGESTGGRLPGRAGRVEHVSAEELQERLARGDVVLLDVRPEPEFKAGHISGAQSVPLDALASLAPKLPRRRQIVTYCRGPYCVYADDAVRVLQARGLEARRLDVGFPEWRRAGLPVETS
jgi:rhodanese-related sulfurtransferase